MSGKVWVGYCQSCNFGIETRGGRLINLVTKPSEYLIRKDCPGVCNY